MPESGGEGGIVAQGGSSAGFSLLVQDGKLVYHFNWLDEDHYIIKSSEPVPPGKSTVRFEFTLDEGEMVKGGNGTLFLNDKQVGRGRMERTVPGRFGIDTCGVGMDTGPAFELARIQERLVIPSQAKRIADGFRWFWLTDLGCRRGVPRVEIAGRRLT